MDKELIIHEGTSKAVAAFVKAMSKHPDSFVVRYDPELIIHKSSGIFYNVTFGTLCFFNGDVQGELLAEHLPKQIHYLHITDNERDTIDKLLTEFYESFEERLDEKLSDVLNTSMDYEDAEEHD